MADLLSSIGNIFGGSSETPKLQQAQMPEAAKEQMQALISQAKQSPEQIAQQSMTGVEKGMGMLGGGAPQDFAKTGVQPEKIQAFRNVYGAQTGKALEQLKSQNLIQAEQKKMQKLQMASQLALHAANVQTNYLQTLTDAYNQMEAQRAGLVSAISGIGNQAAGMYFGARAKGIGGGNYSGNANHQANVNPYYGTIA